MSWSLASAVCIAMLGYGQVECGYILKLRCKGMHFWRNCQKFRTLFF